MTNGATNGASSVTNGASSVTNAGTNSASSGGSVYGDAQILLSNASLLNASQITLGDSVMSYDLSTHTMIPAVITAIYVKNVTNKYTFNELLKVDADEIMFINGHWQRAYVAKVGDTLFNPITGQYIKITSINVTHYNNTHHVYDFVTTPLNNYVADGFLIDVKSSSSSVLGTSVAYLANGSTVLVGNLKMGDMVLGYSLSTHQIQPVMVSSVFNLTTTNEYIINNGTLVVDSCEGLYINNRLELAQYLKVGDYLFNPFTNSNVRVNNLVIKKGVFHLYDVITTPDDNIVVNNYLIT